MRDPAETQIDPPPCVGLQETITMVMQPGRPGMGTCVVEPLTGMWRSSAPVERNDETATTQAPSAPTFTPSGITPSGLFGSGVVLPGWIRAIVPPVAPCCWTTYVPAGPAATPVRWSPSGRGGPTVAVKGAAASAAEPDLRLRVTTAIATIAAAISTTPASGSH